MLPRLLVKNENDILFQVSCQQFINSAVRVNLIHNVTYGIIMYLTVRINARGRLDNYLTTHSRLYEFNTSYTPFTR